MIKKEILPETGGNKLKLSPEKVKAIAAACGASQAGLATAEPLFYLRERLLKRAAEGRVTPFEEANIHRRIDPRPLLENCRSILVFAVPYAVTGHPPAPAAPGPRGMVSRCARAVDYHSVVKRVAARIITSLKREYGDALTGRTLCDSSPLVERELARLGGVGSIGENCVLLNRVYGSFTVLGTILLDRDSETDHPTRELCRNCGACRRACPTGALAEPYILNPRLCLSYLTQVKGVIPLSLRSALGRNLYGCDRCLEACPENHTAAPTPFAEMRPFLFPAEPLLLPLLTLTRREFDQSIGLTAAGWRGKTLLQRNAVVALGNSGDEAAVRPLARLLADDSRSLIRLHAAWALGMLGGSRALYHLNRSCLRDPDAAVRREARSALENSIH